MTFKLNEQVTVRVPHLRGNISEIKRGQVVSVSGDRISVQHAGEFKPNVYPVTQVTSAKDSLGLGCNVDDPYAKPVVKLYK